MILNSASIEKINSCNCTCNCECHKYCNTTPPPSDDHHHYGTYEVMSFTPEELVQMPMVSTINGSWGPLSWELDPQIDTKNFLNTNFHIVLKLLGSTILNLDINKDNSHFNLNVGILVAELGIDYTTRRVFLKGYLNYVINKVHFDLTLAKF